MKREGNEMEGQERGKGKVIEGNETERRRRPG